VTYNTYINRLRIEHFTHLYLETKDSLRPPMAKTLAIECGFRSYYTFGTAFKKYKGVTVTKWINSQE
jgi:AraC-like DNA-binding protein